MAVWFFLVLLLCSVQAISGGNASNPLAAVNNTDVRAKYFDLDQGDRMDYYIDGAAMLTPKTKLKYELHYWDTDVTGRDENSSGSPPRSSDTFRKRWRVLRRPPLSFGHRA